MKKIILIAFSLLVLITVTSCSNYYVLTKVSSFGAVPPQKTYYILHSNNEIQADDIEFKWYAEYVDYALAKQGYKKINDYDSASLLILIDYAISEPINYTVSTPVLGEIGTGVFETKKKIKKDGNETTITKESKEKKTIGVTGYKLENITEYVKSFNIYCYDLFDWRTSKKEKMYWKANVKTTNSSDDLRYSFPYLVYSASFYFEKNSVNQRELEIRKNGSAIKKFYDWD